MFVWRRHYCEGSPSSGDDMESDGNDRDSDDDNGGQRLSAHEDVIRPRQRILIRAEEHCVCVRILMMRPTPSPVSRLFIDLLTNHGQKGKFQLIFLCCKNSTSFHLTFNAECSSQPIMKMTLHLIKMRLLKPAILWSNMILMVQYGVSGNIS